MATIQIHVRGGERRRRGSARRLGRLTWPWRPQRSSSVRRRGWRWPPRLAPRRSRRRVPRPRRGRDVRDEGLEGGEVLAGQGSRGPSTCRDGWQPAGRGLLSATVEELVPPRQDPLVAASWHGTTDVLGAGAGAPRRRRRCGRATRPGGTRGRRPGRPVEMEPTAAELELVAGEGERTALMRQARRGDRATAAGHAEADGGLDALAGTTPLDDRAHDLLVAEETE